MVLDFNGYERREFKEGAEGTNRAELVLKWMRVQIFGRGWFLGELEQVKAMIVIQSALADDNSKLVCSVESELLNSDLRYIGAKSLPDPSPLLRKSSYLQGPIVLRANY
ncbi:hypothetical protein L6164_014408 [Bauhinia variegata]|uniref:Uncharacterized protein n=1 Tax=Bauhinia variegata TaxID=167791 RepID=A0ACB9NHD7_BAUVA|nr:hypothetical protein L6164_014408 [Bauhinia variegata]